MSAAPSFTPTLFRAGDRPEGGGCSIPEKVYTGLADEMMQAHVSANTKVVFYAIMWLADHNRAGPWTCETNETIIRIGKIGITSVKRGIKWLEANGWIEKSEELQAVSQRRLTPLWKRARTGKGGGATRPGVDQMRPGVGAMRPGEGANGPGGGASRPGVGAMRPGEGALRPPSPLKSLNSPNGPNPEGDNGPNSATSDGPPEGPPSVASEGEKQDTLEAKAASLAEFLTRYKIDPDPRPRIAATRPASDRKPAPEWAPAPAGSGGGVSPPRRGAAPTPPPPPPPGLDAQGEPSELGRLAARLSAEELDRLRALPAAVWAPLWRSWLVYGSPAPAALERFRAEAAAAAGAIPPSAGASPAVVPEPPPPRAEDPQPDQVPQTLPAGGPERPTCPAPEGAAPSASRPIER